MYKSNVQDVYLKMRSQCGVLNKIQHFYKNKREAQLKYPYSFYNMVNVIFTKIVVQENVNNTLTKADNIK